MFRTMTVVRFSADSVSSSDVQDDDNEEVRFDPVTVEAALDLNDKQSSLPKQPGGARQIGGTAGAANPGGAARPGGAANPGGAATLNCADILSLAFS